MFDIIFHGFRTKWRELWGHKDPVRLLSTQAAKHGHVVEQSGVQTAAQSARLKVSGRFSVFWFSRGACSPRGRVLSWHSNSWECSKQSLPSQTGSQSNWTGGRSAARSQTQRHKTPQISVLVSHLGSCSTFLSYSKRKNLQFVLTTFFFFFLLFNHPEIQDQTPFHLPKKTLLLSSLNCKVTQSHLHC